MEPMAGEWTSAAHSMGVIFCLCLSLRERSLHLLLEIFFWPVCLFSCGNNKPNSNRGFQPELSISTFELDGYVLSGSSSSSSTKRLLHSSSVYALDLDALFLYGDKFEK